MNESTTASAPADASALDLSGYKVQISQTRFGAWVWEVETPDGEALVEPFGVASIERRNAERDALAAIQKHAAKPPPISGEELRQKVEAES